MMRAGQLHERVAFDAPAAQVRDDYGQVVDGFMPADQATECRAHFRYLRGGETVQAARLHGRQPIVVTVRSAAATRAITTDWRMRDKATGTVHNIRSGPVVSDDRLWLEFTVEAGVAT